jgi:fatty acid desaturase
MHEQIKINWYRCKVDKTVMSQLMRRSDARAFAQVLPQLGLFVLTGTLAYALFRRLDAHNWPWVLPLLLLALFAHGTNGSFFGGCACHELCHKTPFATQFWNNFFLRVYAFLGWFDPCSYRASHIRHHQSTTHKDHDGEVVLPLGLDWEAGKLIWFTLTFDPRAWLHHLRFWLAAARGDFTRDGFFKSAWLQRVVPETDTASRREIVRWARTVLIGHLALATTFVLTGHWFLIIIVNLGCQYASWLTLLTGAPQHIGLASDTEGFRLCCRTLTLNPFVQFIYWHMNYHTEHHMYAAVPCYRLGTLHRIIRHDLPPTPHGLRAVWKQIAEVKRREAAEPGWIYMPSLPNPAGSKA